MEKARDTPEDIGLRLRPAGDADHDAIAEIWHDSASLPGVGPASMPTPGQFRLWVGEEFAAGWTVTVAVADGVVVGFAALRPEQAVLDQLFIQPGAIGSGVGRALLAHVKSTMPQGFSLFTRPGNARARRFYEKAGLVLLREAPHPQNGETDPVVYYGWTAR